MRANIILLSQTEITATQDMMLLSSAAAVVLLLCVKHLHGSALPAVSSYEFTAYRMQQYNLGQQKHGKITPSMLCLDKSETNIWKRHLREEDQLNGLATCPGCTLPLAQ